MNGWIIGASIAGTLVLLANAAVLVFGRLLARRREIEGYVRDEDRLNTSGTQRG